MDNHFRWLQRYFLLGLGMPQSVSSQVLRALSQPLFTTEDYFTVCKQLFEENGWSPSLVSKSNLVGKEDYCEASKGKHGIALSFGEEFFICVCSIRTSENTWKSLQFYRFWQESKTFDKGLNLRSNILWDPVFSNLGAFEFWKGIVEQSQLQVDLSLFKSST